MSNARIDSYRGRLRQPLLVLAMHVGRICAARLRPVTVGELQDLLHCSRATAFRYLAAYNAVYADRTAAQACGTAACAIAAHGLAGAAGGALSASEALDAALRAAASAADAFDNCDDAGADDAAA